MTDVLVGGGRLTWSEARQTPCASCTQSYCCTHVRLHRFDLRSVVDVDLARYLLNFEGIVLGLGPEFDVSVYLNQPCSHLEPASGLCQVHGTDEQPGECRHYPAFSCAYRQRMADGNDPEHILLDRARFHWLANQLFFDDGRRLVAGPEWTDILAAMAAMPLGRQPATPKAPDSLIADWQEVVLGRRLPADVDVAVSYGDDAVQSPCKGCAAYCCQVLVFDQKVPENVGELDRVRYLLGFPSIELAVAEGDWSILVHTTCRHLSGSECSVYGQPERPLQCGALPAIGCEYKPMLGAYDPDRQIRLTAGLLPVLEGAIAYRGDGTVLAIPPIPMINRLVQDAMRAGAV